MAINLLKFKIDKIIAEHGYLVKSMLTAAEQDQLKEDERRQSIDRILNDANKLDW